jgi:hypothetical protein
MTPVERKRLWQQHITDWQASGLSGKVAAVPGPETSEGLTVSLPGGVSITGLHAGNVELLGAVLRQL